MVMAVVSLERRNHIPDWPLLLSGLGEQSLLVTPESQCRNIEKIQRFLQHSGQDGVTQNLAT